MKRINYEKHMKAIACFPFILVVLFGCKEQKKGNADNEITIKSMASQNFYVGTYTDGDSEGIYQYTLREDGNLEKIGFSAKTENPSFLAYTADKKFLLAVNELDKNGTGNITSYAVKKDSLIFVNQRTSGGAHPCFVNVNNNGDVLVANYTGGNISLLQINENGELMGPQAIQDHSGTNNGTGNSEKNISHAHSAWFMPNSDTGIVSVDLGTNQLWFSDLNKEKRSLDLSKPATLELPKGAGPRHLSFHPNEKWAYTVNELNSTVSFISRSEKGYKLMGSYTTLPKDFKEESFCADIHISPDGSFLYASNRGHNSIVIYKIDKNDGSLAVLGHQEVHGEWPRNFSLSPDGNFLIVANQHTDNIVAFKRDLKTGLLEYASQIEAPSPVCILF